MYIIEDHTRAEQTISRRSSERLAARQQTLAFSSAKAEDEISAASSRQVDQYRFLSPGFLSGSSAASGLRVRKIKVDGASGGRSEQRVP